MNSRVELVGSAYLSFGRALERLRELGDVEHCTVDTVPVGRVRVSPDTSDGSFGLDVLRPSTGKGDEEQLVPKAGDRVSPIFSECVIYGLIPSEVESGKEVLVSGLGRNIVLRLPRAVSLNETCVSDILSGRPRGRLVSHPHLVSALCVQVALQYAVSVSTEMIGDGRTLT